MRSRLLRGFRVLDLSTSLAYDCGRILASLGAEVIRIDPPAALGGAKPSLIGPQTADAQEFRLHAWRVGNIDKRCLTLDLEEETGRVTLMKLVKSSDFVIESFQPGYLGALGLGFDDLSATNPRIILTSITPFGQNGPYAAYKAGELVVSAMSGVLALCGDEDRPPVKEALNAHCFHTSASAVTGTMLAHAYRQRTGQGQHVDVSMQECGVTRNTTGLLAYQFDKRLLQRRGPCLQFGKAVVRYVWRLRDGHAIHTLISGKMGAPANAALSVWMDELGYANPMSEMVWERYDRTTHDPSERQKWEGAMGAFFAERSKDDIGNEGVVRGINAAVINQPLEALYHKQIIARENVADAHIDGAIVRVPKTFVRTGHEDDVPVRIPVDCGEESATLLDELFHGRGEVTVGEQKGTFCGDQALRGLKVLDFSWVVVGGMLTKQFADHGADVIKVETIRRLCGTRIEAQTANSNRANPDDKPWFAHLNTSKRSLRLDLKSQHAREVLDRLIDWADVVVENFTPGTMEKLGIGYEQLKERKPNIVMVSGSVFGQTGPFSREWGIDSTGAALSGRVHMTGWPDRDPVVPSVVYGDGVLPMVLSAAAVAALDYRDRTGLGCHVDGSMLEVQTQQLVEASMRQQISGQAPCRQGNRVADCVPHGVFPCKGQDRWIAISVFDDAEWTALCEVLGQQSSATDPRFGTFEARKEHEGELEDLIAQWTNPHDAYLLMKQLQDAGVAAGVVQTTADLLERDPQLRSRGFLLEVDHPVLGRFEQQTTPYKLSRTPAKPGPAPCFGQHTQEICLNTLHFSEAEFQRLHEAEVFV